MNVQVKVLLFGKLKEKLGTGTQAQRFKDLDELKAWLRMAEPELMEGQLLFAVNQEIVRENVAFAEGDEIAVMPPFAGG